MLAEHGVFALATLLAGRLGTAQLAAHHVALTLAATSFMVPLGIGAAASVRVGGAVGARDRVGARRAGAAALLLGALWAIAAGAAFVLAPARLAHALSPEPSTIAAAVPLLFVAAVFQLSDGAQAILAGALRGAGDTRWPLVANLAGHWLVGLPVSLIAGFSLGRGAVGLWWGLSAGLIAVACALGLRFHVLSSREIARS
jgi:multidrug resistance protein, MATE family